MKYIGIQIVDAQAQAREKDGQPGYFVTYSDGRTSWKPKVAFEFMYLPLGEPMLKMVEAYMGTVPRDRFDYEAVRNGLAFVTHWGYCGLPHRHEIAPPGSPAPDNPDDNTGADEAGPIEDGPRQDEATDPTPVPSATDPQA